MSTLLHRSTSFCCKSRSADLMSSCPLVSSRSEAVITSRSTHLLQVNRSGESDEVEGRGEGAEVASKCWRGGEKGGGDRRGGGGGGRCVA
jgi:hypothetical protein